MEYVGGRVDAEYRITMSWDFKAKLASTLPQESIEVAQDDLGSVPLRGEWCLSVNSNGDDLIIKIKHGELPVGAFGDCVTVMGEFAYLLDNGALQQIDAGIPPQSEQPRRDSNGSSHRSFRFLGSKSKLAEEEKLPHAIQKRTQQYRFSITSAQRPSDRLEPKPDLSKALANLSNLAHSPTRDVRLLFKRSADNLELELWTTRISSPKPPSTTKPCSLPAASKRSSRAGRNVNVMLSRPSPSSRSSFPAPGATPAVDLSVDWQDSDDETDAFLVERDWMKCTTTKQDTAEFDYQEIEVHETAYSTMCAVLLYLQTGHIKFAPLRSSSSHGLSPDEFIKKRNASLTKSLEGQPTLPPAISPISVYRLAHLLERNDLQQKALDALASSLTILGAADELFSPVSVAYDQVRKFVFDFVVKNWDEVKATESWRAVRNNVARGHGQAAAEGAAQILFDLLAAINDK